MKHQRTLELEEDLEFHARQWRVSQALWVFLLALMAATATGLFGNGLLSRGTAGHTGGPLRIEYDRVARFGLPLRLVVHARPSTESGRTISFTIDRAYLDGFSIQRITPEPASASIVDAGVQYVFETQSPGAAAVVFDMQPATRWKVSGRIRSGEAAVALTQLILP